MFVIDCKHPGCANYALFTTPMKDWDCGQHQPPKPVKGYLPSRHPARQPEVKYKYGSRESHL